MILEKTLLNFFGQFWTRRVFFGVEFLDNFEKHDRFAKVRVSDNFGRFFLTICSLETRRERNLGFPFIFV